MIVEPKVREFICTTAHPVGCMENVNRQISYVKSLSFPMEAAQHAKKVLISAHPQDMALLPVSPLLLDVMLLPSALCLKNHQTENALPLLAGIIQQHLRKLPLQTDCMQNPSTETHFQKK